MREASQHDHITARFRPDDTILFQIAYYHFCLQEGNLKREVLLQRNKI